MLPWSPRYRNLILFEKSSYSGETGLFISILRNIIKHLPKNKAIRYIWSTNGNWIVTFSGFGKPRLNFPVSLKIGMDWTIQTAESRRPPSLPSTDKIYNYPAHTNYFSIVPSYLPELINDSNFEGVEHAVGWEAPLWGGAAVNLPGETVLTHSCSPRACASRICHPEIPPAMEQAHSSPCLVLGNAQSSSWLTDMGLQHRDKPLPVLCSDFHGNIKIWELLWTQARLSKSDQADKALGQHREVSTGILFSLFLFHLFMQPFFIFTSSSRKGLFPPKGRLLFTSNWK